MSSSSSEEDDSNLREALAPGFTIDAVKKSILMTPIKKSSVPVQPEPAQFKKTSSQYVAPKVSEDNQKYLAKELSKYLDSTIEEKDTVYSAKKKTEISSDDGDCGVRLFSSSNASLCSVQYVAGADESARPQQKHVVCKRKLDEFDEESENDKIKQSAVSTEWVLQKKGDYGRLCRKPGEIIDGAVHSWDKNLKKENGK